MKPAVQAATASIDEAAWIPIHYPNAIWDEAEQRLVSDAEVAEVAFTAFTSRKADDHITARLIVRRVRRLNPTTVAEDQDEVSPATVTSWVGLGRGIGITPDPFPQAARRTGHATLAASGSPCANAEGQPLTVVSLGVHGVAMFAPR
jgi:hypothetical protein